MSEYLLQEGDVVIYKKCEHVVEKAWQEPDGYGHGYHDVYAGGWCVKLRKLTAGEYRPQNRLTEKLIQTGCDARSGERLPENIKPVRKMKKVFI